MAYLPEFVKLSTTDVHTRKRKTDPCDAYIIAKATRMLEHTLRSLNLADNELAELTMLCGFDENVAGQNAQTSNRVRGLQTQIRQGRRVCPLH